MLRNIKLIGFFIISLFLLIILAGQAQAATISAPLISKIDNQSFLISGLAEAGNEILIYFDRESPKEWSIQLIDLGGKSMLSQKINTSLNNPMLINTTEIPSGYFRIQLQSNQYHFNFPCLLFD